jgi:hypothetical protein
MPAEESPGEIPGTEEGIPYIHFRDAIRLGVFVLGTAAGLALAHYVEKRQDALLEEA